MDVDSDEIRLVVADDQAMVREALATLLGMEEGIRVVGAVPDGDALLEFLETDHENVDVIALDVEMPQLDGLIACAAVKRRFPHVRVLMVTTFGRPGYVRRALEAGADGFVVKDAPLEELTDAIRSVHAGERVLGSKLAVATLMEGDSPLTPRETDVLVELWAGGGISDVAKVLGLSQGTIRNYVSSAMEKLGARNGSDAARIAFKKGWL